MIGYVAVELCEERHVDGKDQEKQNGLGPKLNDILNKDGFFEGFFLPLLEDTEEDSSKEYIKILKNYRAKKTCFLLSKCASKDPIFVASVIKIAKYTRKLNTKETILQSCLKSYTNVDNLVENAKLKFSNRESTDEEKVTFRESTDEEKVTFIANLIDLSAERLKEHPKSLQNILDLNKFIKDSDNALSRYFCDDVLLTPMIEVIQRYSQDMSLDDCPEHRHKCASKEITGDCPVCTKKQEDMKIRRYKNKNKDGFDKEAPNDGKENSKMLPSKNATYHNMMIMFLKITYSLKNMFPDKYEKTLHAVLKSHNYRDVCIKDCIESDTSILSSIKPVLAKDLKDLLPKHETTASISSWVSTAGILSAVGTVWTVNTNLQDYALDWRICAEYLNFTSFCNENQYTCDMKEMATERTSTNGDTVTRNNDTCTEVKTITQIDPLLPFRYALIVMILVHLVQFGAVIKKRGDIYKPMIYYLVGACCKNKKLGGLQHVKRWLITCMVGFMLPFVSKLFIIRMAIKYQQFEDNIEVYAKFKDFQHKYREKFPRKQKDHDCKFCKSCTDSECVCFHCGFISKNNSDKTMDYYNEQLLAMKENTARIESIDRHITISLEDTYNPLLQVFIILPLIARHISGHTVTDTSTAGGIVETASYYSTLIFHLWSVVSSVMAHANAATAIYFLRPKKQSIGKVAASKLLYQGSALLMIASRITTMTIFAMACFPVSHYAPLYLVIMCWGHVIIVCTLRFVLRKKSNLKGQIETSGISMDPEDPCYRHPEMTSKILWQSLKGSVASMFINIKGDEDSSIESDKLEKIGNYHDDYVGGKSMERLLFGSLMWTEQIVMLFCIGYLGVSEDTNINVHQVIPSILAMFVLGNILEGVMNIYQNPFAILRFQFNTKKNCLLIVIAGIVVSSIIGVTIYVYLQEAQTKNFENFIPLVIVEMIAIIVLILMYCKKC